MKSKLFQLAIFALCAFGFGSSTAGATPVTWYLDDVTFTGGATASGSFIYDASSNTYSGVDIMTTAGTLPAMTFTSETLGTKFGFDANAGLENWLIVFESALTDAGGTIALNSNLSVDSRVTIRPPSAGAQIASGFVTTDASVVIGPGDDTTAPEPSTLGLVPLGLLALFARKRIAGVSRS